MVNIRPSACHRIGEIVGQQSFVNFNDGYGHFALCLYSDRHCQRVVDDIEGYGDGTTGRARVSADVQSFKVIDSNQIC